MDMVTNILAGDYRFHYYASSSWMDLVELYLQSSKSTSPPPELVSALEMLVEQRAQTVSKDQSGDASLEKRPSLEFESFRSLAPRLQSFLLMAFCFQRKSANASSDYHIKNGQSALSCISLRVQPCLTCQH